MAAFYELEIKLKSKGYKLTKARRILLSELHKYRGKSVSVQELHFKIKDQGVDFSTVFRNMEILAKEGLVSIIRRDNGITGYELCSGEHHHHLICTNCGAVTCFEYCPLESIPYTVLDGFNVKEHRFEILGVCKKCAMMEIKY